MTLAEKFSALLSAQSDEEIFAAIDKLTDKQKNMLIAAVVKTWNENKMSLDDIFKGEQQ